uniref:Amino acid transporter transmembrane domain-containing protein n=1 Tax=Zooxanthella nutricula TaxID=1333877 RepID=A0A7S2KVB5_9DINO
MGITTWVESALIGYDTSKYLSGWIYGFADTTPDDLWAIIGIIGAVVMPHNLYLHSASCRTRTVQRTPEVVRRAVTFMSWEPALPIFVTFFISAATVVVAAQRIYGKPGADDAGLTDFYDYVTNVRGSRWLWGLSLLAAGQSSAITTTYAGQYVMDGFLKIRLPMWKRALLTRLVAIAPCVAVAVAMTGPALNQAVNIVNGSLAWLLPFALTPLVKFTTSPRFMGEYAAGPVETVCAWGLAFAVYAVNAVCLSCPGGGFFGDLLFGSGAAVQMGPAWVLLCAAMVGLQIFSLAWNAYIALMPIRNEMPALETQRDLETEFTVAREAQVAFVCRPEIRLA